MPTYGFRDKNTGEEFDRFMSISELRQFLSDNPHIEQTPSLPTIVSGVDRKPDAGFRDVLKEIKKKHSQGITKSTVNTF